MAELTIDHIRNAAQAADKLMASHGFPAALTYATPEQREFVAFDAMRAAAPFLQLPWDEATAEEVLYANTKGCSYGLILSDAAGVIIDRFVRRRNASLMPKPVDPRIDLIDKALCNFMYSLNNTEERTKAAQAIIAVLDEVK